MWHKPLHLCVVQYHLFPVGLTADKLLTLHSGQLHPEVVVQYHLFPNVYYHYNITNFLFLSICVILVSNQLNQVSRVIKPRVPGFCVWVSIFLYSLLDQEARNHHRPMPSIQSHLDSCPVFRTTQPRFNVPIQFNTPRYESTKCPVFRFQIQKSLQYFTFCLSHYSSNIT